MVKLAATLAVDARDWIGEAPVWDAVGAHIVWSDIRTGVIHEGKPDSRGGWYEHRRWDLGRPFGTAIPRHKGGLIVLSGTEVFMLDDDGVVVPYIRLDGVPSAMNFNDGKCDPRGRLWAGTFAHDHSPCGILYRIDPDGTVSPMLENLMGSNGLDWSPDDSIFYHIDSTRQTVSAYDFDIELGTICKQRVIVSIARGEGIPDGMTVDRDGCLWIAVVGRGVRKYAPDGRLLARVDTSTPMVTSCAFGGSDGQDLFITSVSMTAPPSALGLLGFTQQNAEEITKAPGTGGLFVCRPGSSGKPATPFAG